MNAAEQQLQQHLREHGYSLTKPRLIIFNALTDHEPRSMATLVAACQDKLDRATVYRTIDLFEHLGIVQRLQIGWKYKLELTDTFTHHHHHLTCLRCGKVIPLAEDKALENRLHELANTYKFTPQDHQLEIRGVCVDCQKSAS